MNPSNTTTLRPRSRSRRNSLENNEATSEAATAFHGAGTTPLLITAAAAGRGGTGNGTLPPMQRSGSWGGVDESDEDELRVIQENINSSAYVQIISSNSPAPSADEHRGSAGLHVHNPSSFSPGTEDSGYSGVAAGGQGSNPGSDFELPDLNSMSLEERLRRRLAFFFMNPIEKFVARRQTPWKLILQFVKVILVTTQLVIFGQFRYDHTNFYSDSKITFEHMFFKNWDSVREITAYPPATGKFAIYDKQTFYDIFDHAGKTFLELEDIAVSPMKKNSSLGFCMKKMVGHRRRKHNKHHEKDNSDDSNLQQANRKNYVIGNLECIEIPDANLTSSFDSRAYLRAVGAEVPWYDMHRMHFNFSVRTETFRQLGNSIGPECFLFKVFIHFDNEDHDGQIPMDLTLSAQRLRCNNPDLIETSSDVKIIVLNYVVIGTCALSLVLCLRALLRAQSLRVETKKFFRINFQTKLTFCEEMQFLNLWYVVICINDILIIIGSIIVELIETRKSTADLWDFCCVFLGTGDLLVWIGMLRYLGFFRAYNALILTLRGALPNVARFVVCASFLYAGYTFCGWLVFAPYHFKFQSLESTSECLFSLINGDDMFATFSMMSEKAGLIRAFSRVYLYTFVMLFIYVILSLFIAIIMDTYENIKEYYEEGFPMTRVDQFYQSTTYDPYSTAFYDGSSPGSCFALWSWLMTKLYGHRWKGYERMVSDYRRATANANANANANAAAAERQSQEDQESRMTATPPVTVSVTSPETSNATVTVTSPNNDVSTSLPPPLPNGAPVTSIRSGEAAVPVTSFQSEEAAVPVTSFQPQEAAVTTPEVTSAEVSSQDSVPAAETTLPESVERRGPPLSPEAAVPVQTSTAVHHTSADERSSLI